MKRERERVREKEESNVVKWNQETKLKISHIERRNAHK